MKHFKILILGAGSGGISVAARLRRELPASEIALIEPAEFHFYQPLWTLVGAGLARKEKTKRPMARVIPRGVRWIRDRVAKVDPGARRVECVSGTDFTYDFLLVATGLQLDWGKIRGIEGQVGKNGICSIYQYEDAEQTAEMLRNFRGGEAIFTMPPVPIKCAGAPQKILYLADEIFRENGVRGNSRLTFAVAGGAIFGVPAFAAPLLKVAARKEIDLKFLHKLVEVRPETKTAVFEKSAAAPAGGTAPAPELVEMYYDLLHVVPPMSAHAYVRESGLAFASGAQAGWLQVDKHTLQHETHPNVFGIGDVTGVPNSKTGAAIRKQAPVVAANMLDALSGRPLGARYDGYASCPLITGVGKVILAEFGYDGKLLPSFPMDMTKERRSMWHLKKDLLPTLYWNGMMKGRL